MIETQAVTQAIPATEIYSDDLVEIRENDFAYFDLFKNGQILASSASPIPLLRKAYSDNLLPLREVLELAAGFGVAREFVIIH